MKKNITTVIILISSISSLVYLTVLYAATKTNYTTTRTLREQNVHILSICLTHV